MTGFLLFVGAAGWCIGACLFGLCALGKNRASEPGQQANPMTANIAAVAVVMMTIGGAMAIGALAVRLT